MEAACCESSAVERIHYPTRARCSDSGARPSEYLHDRAMDKPELAGPARRGAGVAELRSTIYR